MITVRNHNERGQTNMDWLKSYHTFSFGHYYNPNYKGFRDLLVINEDYVQPGQGFGMHPHKNMEILTYVMEGALRHTDGLGNHSVLQKGEIQRMSAGTGIVHSEYNDSTVNPVHFLQIWIQPWQKEIAPGYEHRDFQSKKRNEWILIASPNSKKESLKIHQDAKIYLANLDRENRINYNLKEQRHLWLQMVHGSIRIGKHTLKAGDGMAVEQQKNIEIIGNEKSQFLVFDLR